MNIREKSNNAIIFSVSSDIGTEMAKRWVSYGWQIIGTYRTETSSIKGLSDIGVNLLECDLSDDESVKSACKKIQELCLQWDILVLCPGTQNPVGSFDSVDFDAWAISVRVNFVNQLRIVRELLPKRNRDNELGPCVLFFAGGGTNNATVNYSAYTISKIALIKMCELLDAEIQDTRFTIVGPGWVKTKIHESTVKAGVKAGDNLKRTMDKFTSNEFTPMQDVLDCCDWLIKSPREVISGRNFSVVFDMWGTDELSDKLVEGPDMYKLRRYGNNLLIRR
ncbi:MAG: SDR family NAD(P)-dependent oxidoreductase [Bacteroidia bacterium]|nr:SDR family NAD(P)-dependent oxidoreductase [Bacteroidia bacterium]